ncbi:hypothetical protein, partial [Corynebacterium accolens]|uniref:hypothetical protein n=1 Tax=Corynebacterium accolens TaxID=38284 RepID=UPI00254395B0
MSEIKYVDTYIDMTDQDLARELVGKKIIKINTEYNTITLHDGTVLKFHDMRLPSFGGHPISADFVSVGEDVHCES